MITCKSEWPPLPSPSATDLVVSPAPVKEDIHQNAFKGKATSIQRIPNCGHLVPLVQPDRVADTILVALGSLPAGSRL